jgi:large subunit ribosomal protein L22
MPYSYELDKEDEKKIAKAFGKEINISSKKANEVCHAVRGMRVDKAIAYLEKVIKREAFVHFRRYNKKVGHKTGGKPGRYPVKAAKKILEIIKNAKANAERKDLNDERLKIEHITAYKAVEFPRIKPKGGKGSPRLHNLTLTNVEVILREF